MNIHVKVLNRSLGNQVHQYIERLYSTIMPVLSRGYKDVSTHANYQIQHINRIKGAKVKGLS